MFPGEYGRIRGRMLDWKGRARHVICWEIPSPTLPLDPAGGSLEIPRFRKIRRPTGAQWVHVFQGNPLGRQPVALALAASLHPMAVPEGAAFRDDSGRIPAMAHDGARGFGKES